MSASLVGSEMCIRDSLQREHQNEDQPLELPRSALDRAIGLGIIRGRRLHHSLRAQALGDSPAQIHQRGLTTGLPR
eukprot:2667946-Alexandrium_andersonii.AAC.1